MTVVEHVISSFRKNGLLKRFESLADVDCSGEEPQDHLLAMYEAAESPLDRDHAYHWQSTSKIIGLKQHKN